MGRQILVVDDSVTIRKAIDITFAHEDFDLKVVDNGADAIGALSANSPDLALIDVGLPDQSGMDLARKIREDFPDASFPIILMGSDAEPLSQNQIVDVGADAHITKPFETQKLIDEVKGALGIPVEDNVAAIRVTPKTLKAQEPTPAPTPEPAPVAPEVDFDDATVADEEALPAAMGTETEVDFIAPPSLDIPQEPALPPVIEMAPPAEDTPAPIVVPPPAAEAPSAPITPPVEVAEEPTPAEPAPSTPAPAPIVFKGPPPPTIKRAPPPAPAKPKPVVADAGVTSDIIVPPVAGDAPPPIEFAPPVEAHEPPAVEPIPPAPEFDEAEPPLLEADAIEEIEDDVPPTPVSIPAPEAPTMMVRAINPEPAVPAAEPEAFRPEPTLSVPAMISEVPDLGINFDLDSEDSEAGDEAAPVDLTDLESLMPAIEAAVRKVTAEVVERVVWEVVPDLAERLIREKLAETDLER